MQVMVAIHWSRALSNLAELPTIYRAIDAINTGGLFRRALSARAAEIKRP